MPVQNALLFSDVHLGWVPCRRSHEHLLAHLNEAADDAELIVINGDVLDVHRGAPGAPERAHLLQFAEQVASWRAEGREVIYIEGNHDPMYALDEHGQFNIAGLHLEGLAPDRWSHRFEGWHGERIHVLHGHRFTDAPWSPGPYEALGRHALIQENLLYHKVLPIRAAYPWSIGWVVGAVGWTESALWRRKLEAQTRDARAGADVLVHGHFHSGPGTRPLGEVTSWRTGAWVAQGHLGTDNRMLRYRSGVFERIALEGGRWRNLGDGR